MPIKQDFPKVIIRVVRAIFSPKDKSVTHQTIREYGIGDQPPNTYKREADVIQDELDRDCDPCRAYVCEADTGVALYAGRQNIRSY